MNTADIIIILILAVVIGLAVRRYIKQLRSGGCSCGCENCNMPCAKKDKT